MFRPTVARTLLDAVGCVARRAPRIITAATASLGIAGLVFTTGCYTYDVKAPTDLQSGQLVEVTVNNIGRVALTADLGDDVSKVDGTVVAVTDSVLRMRAVSMDYLSGISSPFPGGEISIPRTGITTVSTKQYSRSKTAIVAIGLSAALIAVIGAIVVAGSGGSQGQKDGGNNGGIQ